MPQLPPPPSKRRTASRLAKLDCFYNELKENPRLNEITTTNPTFSEREICLHVQAILDDCVQTLFRPRVLRDVTWSQTANSRPMPRVEAGGHSYYPDHIVLKNDFSIAIEVKRYTGQSSILQQVIGQSMIYSQRYGFVLAFIADVTKDGCLAQQIHREEQAINDEFLHSELWWYHNTAIVCRHVKERFTER